MLSVLVASSIVGCTATGINFLALGDWGGSPLPPYTRHGQVAAVKGMDKVATALNADFIVAVGDNFYTEGVESSDSARFENTFNSVYSPASLQKDWYVCAGNHDHKGNVSAQIEYSGMNSRWKFPAEYHTHSFSADGVTLDLIMLDTSGLASSSKITDETAAGYFDPLPEVPRSFGETQWDWIEAQLKASTADYLIVGGHYPVYSACEHGNTDTLITNLKPLLETYEAHYISGHDHCMEHIQESGSKVNHILTGMGDGCCYWAENKDNVPKGEFVCGLMPGIINRNGTDSLKWYISRNNAGLTSAGFTSLSATQEGLSVVFYDQDGTVIYTAPTIAPRAIAKK